ncbi:MAG: UDP-N-acetylmuramoyl-tripeptide--D-alanyl-D-alanine ligase [candidate division Zixibacteria bacterium]|nr:UDP-N-acetylmuramoyl-tripeptide--D-alanyl-D-alanine ligase [candidate division Zixibacteria bacterium]
MIAVITMTIDDACQIMNGDVLTRTRVSRRFRGVCIDSRALKRGNAFVCLRGERTDGHRFAATAGARGAGAIIAERDIADDWREWTTPVIGVDDPLTALGDLTAAYKDLFPTRYLAVTGSVGKTTTKEMIAAVLATRYSVFKSPGNYNNLIGIPLAMLARKAESRKTEEIGVLEFGMSTPGEIARLTEMIQPDWGVVTQIAPSHTMQLKTLSRVARAKRELFDYAKPRTIAFLNADDPHQRKWYTNWDRTTVTYALDRDADIVADQMATDRAGRTSFRVNGRHDFRLKLPGEHNVRNALASIAVGRRFRIPFAEMADALSRVKPEGSRSSVERLGQFVLLDDCYNASPSGLAAALRTLKDWPGAARRIAVLGAMRELGDDEIEWHRRLGMDAAQSCDVLVTVGELASNYGKALSEHPTNAQHKSLKTLDQAIAYLKRELRPGDVVLLKASHSEQFETIGAALREHAKRNVRRTRKAN